MALSNNQTELLEKLGLPTDFANLPDESLDNIEDALSAEMQLHGLNEQGDGLNEYGELCRSVIIALPD